MKSRFDYVIEDAPEGKSLVATGAWSSEAAEALARGEADGLVLNYARGFQGPGLGFLDSCWGLRRLNILDRSIDDLEPVGRLGASLEELSVQAAPAAELDLDVLEKLRAVAGEWQILRRTISSAAWLERVITWRFDEVDLHAFRNHFELKHLELKDSPALKSLSGLSGLPALENLKVIAARNLQDISDVTGLSATIQDLELEDCPSLGSLDEVAPLSNLRFLGFSDCGSVESLVPLRSLQQLEVLYLWGSTTVMDGDLSVLGQLPKLKELRMRSRRHYRPSVTDLEAAVF